MMGHPHGCPQGPEWLSGPQELQSKSHMLQSRGEVKVLDQENTSLQCPVASKWPGLCSWVSGQNRGWCYGLIYLGRLHEQTQLWNPYVFQVSSLGVRTFPLQNQRYVRVHQYPYPYLFPCPCTYTSHVLSKSQEFIADDGDLGTSGRQRFCKGTRWAAVQGRRGITGICQAAGTVHSACKVLVLLK